MRCAFTKNTVAYSQLQKYWHSVKMGKKLIWKKCLWLILSYVSCKFTPINHKRHFFNLFYQGCHNSGIDGMLYDWLHHLWTLIKQLFGKKKLIMNSGTTKQFSGRLYVWVCVQVFFIWFLFFYTNCARNIGCV